MSSSARPPKQLWKIHAFRRRIGEWDSPETECSAEYLGKLSGTLFSERNEAQVKADTVRNREVLKPTMPGWTVRLEVRPAIDIR